MLKLVSMRDTVRFLTIVLLFAAPLTAQRDIAGETWGRWKGDRRIGYLIGFHAGLKTDRGLFDTAESVTNRRAPGATRPLIVARYKEDRKDYYSPNIKYDFKTLARMIDAFYSDPDNMQITLPIAILILRLRDSDKLERARLVLLTERRKVLSGN